MMRTIIILSLVLLMSCNQSESDTTTNNNATTPQGKTEAITTPKKAAMVNRTVLKEEIDALEAKLSVRKTKSADKTMAKDLITKSELFGLNFPNDPLTPAYLFRAAEVANSVGGHDVAIKLFAQVHRDYPKHEKAAPALFLEAFTFENNLGDKENAVKFYQKFVDRYPDHVFAKDAQQLILNINKSPEELVKEFQNKNK